MEDEVYGVGASLPCGKSLAEITAGPKLDERITAAKPPPPAVSRPARLLIVGLALGAMGEVMLYESALGIGVPLFAICVAAGLIVTGHWESEKSIRWRNVTPLTVTTLFFAAMVAIRGGGLITALNIAFCLRLGTLLIGMFSRQDILKIGMGDLIGMPWRIAGQMAFGAAPVVQSVPYPGSGARQRFLLSAGRGVLLALPVLVVVIALFSSADARFAEKVGEATRWLFPADYWDRIFRVAFAITAAWAAIGAIAYAVSGIGASSPSRLPKHAPGFTEAMTVLVLVNAVFFSFVALQFGSLFSGAQRVSSLPASAYTEYVHDGFGQLICVALIAVVLISGLCAAIDPCSIDRKRRLILNGSGIVLLGLTLVILLSAAQRMSVYEAFYGATVMRTYVDDFILFLALALLWRGVTLYARETQAPSFGAGILACLVGFGIAVNFQNPEGAAVRTNIARYHATRKIDNYFFSQSVSADAVHDLGTAFRATSGELHATIGTQLRLTLEDLEKQRHSDKWSSWHAGRASALAELKALSPELPPTDTSAH